MKKLFLLSFLVFITACSTSSNSVSDFASAESKAFKNIAAQYEKGEKEATRGEKLITKGRKLVERGREDIRNGENGILNGNIMIREARNLYAQETGYISASEDLKDIESIATTTDQTKAIAKQWQDGVDMVKKANKRIASGNSKIEDGEESIRQGRSLVEKGSKLMRKSENDFNQRKSAL